MTFLRVHNLPKQIPPGRLYDHSSGKDVFPNDLSSKFCLNNDSFLFNERELIDYFIAISWGDEGIRMFDIFGYSGLKDNWKANPEVKSWVLKNGVYIHTQDITCGEGLILFGREEEYRRKTKDLEEYLSNPLNIDEINKILEFH